MLAFLVLTIPLIFTGSVAGQAITDHPDIRKVGFTGSTPIGAGIMKR